MAVTYFPFNSIVVDGVPDRPANAENLAAYLAGFFSNGVVMQTDTALQVSPSSGMNVQIAIGVGTISGKTIINDTAKIITLDTASASLARIDRVVFRLDEVNRLMEFDVLKGTPASSPVAPALTQNADVYELCLAEIRVPAGATSITASCITDKRSDKSLCGAASIPPHMQDVGHGGTGKSAHTSNSVLTGNGTDAVKNVASANGALYAKSANGAPVFGTLPVAQGGTGKTSLEGIFDLLNIGISTNGSSGQIAISNIGIEWGVIYVTPSTANGSLYYGDATLDFFYNYAETPHVGVSMRGGNYIATLYPSTVDEGQTSCKIRVTASNKTERRVRYLVIGERA